MPNKTEPKYPIDLGKKPSDLGVPMPASESDKMPETIYPSLYLEWEKPYGFPDEGTMTVKFKKRSEENRKTGDKTVQRVELDILEILDTEGKDIPDKEEEDSGDVLDKEMKKLSKKKVDKTDEEDGGY